MTIKHHPEIANLMCCAAGSQSEAHAAVMACHMAMCHDCRKDLANMEVIGAALFENLAPETVDRPAPVPALRAAEADVLEASHSQAGSSEAAKGDIPFPLQKALGTNLDALPWKWLAPGVKYVDVPLTPGAKGHLRLVKVAPGQAMPEHGHGGSELTLLLRGSYKDADGEYHRGDVSDVDEDVVHQPVADPEEGCICLVAYEKKARFQSLIARMIQPWSGM